MSVVFLGLEYSNGTDMSARLNLEILRLLLESNPMSTASITPNTIPITIQIFAPFERVVREKEGADERRDNVGDELAYTDSVVISAVVIIAGVHEDPKSRNVDRISRGSCMSSSSKPISQ